MAAVFQPLVRNAATDTTRNEYPSETQRNTTLAFPLSLSPFKRRINDGQKEDARKEGTEQRRKKKQKKE